MGKCCTNKVIFNLVARNTPEDVSVDCVFGEYETPSRNSANFFVVAYTINGILYSWNAPMDILNGTFEAAFKADILSQAGISINPSVLDNADGTGDIRVPDMAGNVFNSIFLSDISDFSIHTVTFGPCP